MAGSQDAYFTALKNVSFILHRGDIVGIVGRNGSGKSTLLKILSMITKPTAGEARFYGSVRSILDFGSNFHPDMSGRDNVMVQLRIAGIPSAQHDSYYQQIVAFSEIGDFMHQPVKVYSSGMFLRLGFSVAFHLSSDILILDEVLSVGDEGFRLKCREMLKELARSGKTILFVSHNKAEVLELSTRCIWLDKGEIKKIGAPAEVMGEYFALYRDNHDGKKIIVTPEANINDAHGSINLTWDAASAPGNETLAVRRISVTSAAHGKDIYLHDDIVLRFRLEKKKTGINIGAFFFLEDILYQPVMVGHFLNNQGDLDLSTVVKDQTGLIDIECTIPGHLLAPGKYYLRLRFGLEPDRWTADSEEGFRLTEELHFTIKEPLGYTDYIGDLSKGSIRPALRWDIRSASE